MPASAAGPIMSGSTRGVLTEPAVLIAAGQAYCWGRIRVSSELAHHYKVETCHRWLGRISGPRSP